MVVVERETRVSGRADVDAVIMGRSSGGARGPADGRATSRRALLSGINNSAECRGLSRDGPRIF